MNKVLIYAALVTIIYAQGVIASTIYVTDNLQLKLRATASTDGETVTTLHSGQKLSLLENNNKFSRVTTEEGETGWVQSWFLTKEPPASFIVDQTIKEKEVLEEKLAHANDKLKDFDSAVARENKSLKNSIDSLSKKIHSLTSTQDQLEKELAAQSSQLAKYQFVQQYDWKVVVFCFFLFSFVVGFWAARVWIRARERRRLSGYRLAY